MRVVIPYLTLNPATELVLCNIRDRRRTTVEFHDLSDDPERGYYKLLCESWEIGKSFMVIEPDILPWPGAIEEVEACHHLCCTFMGPSGVTADSFALGYGLGCTRFSAACIQAVPDLMAAVGGLDYGGEFSHLDGQVLGTLQERGVPLHFHHPPVIHLNGNRFPYRRSGQ